eukprot:m51a1_g9618 hypothetical protein (1062) ;mRNA; f:1090941-1095440
MSGSPPPHPAPAGPTTPPTHEPAPPPGAPAAAPGAASAALPPTDVAQAKRAQASQAAQAPEPTAGTARAATAEAARRSGSGGPPAAEARKDAEEPLKTRLNGTFRSRELEAAYRVHVARKLGHSSSVLLYSALLAGLLVPLFLYVALQRRCAACEDRAFVATCGAVFAAVAAHTLVALRWPKSIIAAQAGAQLPRSASLSVLTAPTAVLHVVCMVAFCADSFSVRFVCGSGRGAEDSSSGPEERSMRVEDLFWPSFSSGLCGSIYMMFGAVVWPVSAAGWAVCALQIAAIAANHDSAKVLLCYVAWIAIISALGMLNSKERRRDFAASLVLQREQRQALVEKDNTDAIIGILFPKQIARRLCASRLSGVPIYNSQDTLPTGPIVDSVESATAVYVGYYGLESIPTLDGQLQALSYVLLAADRVASLHKAEKIKSSGSTALFVIGAPQEVKENEKIGCRLALDLLRLHATICGKKKLRISLRIGIATGSVIAGVIGLSKPKYDVWGYPVTMAKKLMEVAPPGGIIVTKEVVKSMPDYCLSFSKAPVVSLLEAAATMQEEPQSFRLITSFTADVRFLSSYLSRYRQYPRWSSLGLVAGVLVFLALDIANNVRYPKYLATIVSAIPRIYVAVQTLLMSLVIGLQAYMYNSGMWNDPILSGINGLVLILSFTMLPFAVFASVVVGSFVLYATVLLLAEYTIGSVLLIAVQMTFHLIFRFSLETRIMMSYNSHKRIITQKATVEKEKTAAQGLIYSVVPEPIWKKLEQQPVEELYFADVVPSGTVMVCAITNFDVMCQTVKLETVITTLNTLFSEFDAMARGRGIEPLKTDAGKYIVAGNILRDLETDHAARVVSLALDIVAWIRSFASEIANISVRIGIHTDVLLCGVIRMRSLLFDCWGTSIPIAERIAEVARPNEVVASATTHAATLALFVARQLQPIHVGAMRLDTFRLTRDSSPMMTIAKTDDRLRRRTTDGRLPGEYGVIYEQQIGVAEGKAGALLESFSLGSAGSIDELPPLPEPAMPEIDMVSACQAPVPVISPDSRSTSNPGMEAPASWLESIQNDP